MKHFIIPDVQIKPEDDPKFLRSIGQYIVDKRPDRVICLGDFADMPSLSSYDIGKKQAEGRRVALDIAAVKNAMGELMAPLLNVQKYQALWKKKVYRPDLIMCLGNHEDRITRAVNNDPKLEGTIKIEDLGYEEFGWEVHPFLEVVVREGVAYSHYFPSGVAGRPSSTASAQLNKKHMSCVAGHQQGLQVATAHRADGKRLTSIIAGSCYEHDEAYLGPQGNKHWKGCLMLHEVDDGQFDYMAVSLDYMKGRL
jgi:hypothetical protein